MTVREKEMKVTISPEEAEPPFILAIDVGSSSVRALLFDRLGRGLEATGYQRAHTMRTTVAGAAESDANQLLSAIFECIDGTLAKAGSSAAQISGVACCTFVTNIMGLDEKGEILFPLSSYADTRAAEAVPWLRSTFEEAAVYQRTGCRFHPSYLPARFHWFSQAMPDRFARVTRWLSIGEYLQLELFGEAAVTYSVASWTGLLDRHRLRWDGPLLDELPLRPEQLSPLIDVRQAARGLRPRWAKRWPALRDVAWFPAIGDGAAANIGDGCVSSSQVALTLGTTTAVRAVIEAPVLSIPEGLWCYRVDGDRSLLGGAMTEGGNLFAWMGSTLQLESGQALERAVAEMVPDSHGLTILPFLAGERSPGWVGGARATIHGLTLATTPAEILRAGLESVAYRIAQVCQLLFGALTDEVQLIAGGGAIRRSSTWAQIIADVLRRPVQISQAAEASGRGAALLALEALGALDDLAEAPIFLGQRFRPRPEHQERYLLASQRQQALYRQLIG